jgi:hypothetical protein
LPGELAQYKHLDGRTLFGEESNALRAKVTSLIAKGKQKIVHLKEGTDLASAVVCAQGGQAAPARRFP